MCIRDRVKTEVIAGVTTFLAMAYILAVNPTMLKEAWLSYDGVFLATALSAGIATLIMGLLANYQMCIRDRLIISFITV